MATAFFANSRRSSGCPDSGVQFSPSYNLLRPPLLAKGAASAGSQAGNYRIHESIPRAKIRIWDERLPQSSLVTTRPHHHRQYQQQTAASFTAGKSVLFRLMMSRSSSHDAVRAPRLLPKKPRPI